jgi:hypothetical protein
MQPRAGGCAGQFIGVGEGKQFKVLHETELTPGGNEQQPLF